MSSKLILPWPFPFRGPHWPRPRITQTLLAVAVFNDQYPNSSSVQGVPIVTTGTPSTTALTGAIPALTVSGITPGSSTSDPFYLQGTWELLNGSTVLPPTAAQASPSGAYAPMYWLNTVTYYAGNLYVIGSDGAEFGVLRFDATTGNPNGSGTNPLFLSVDFLIENSGMSLISYQGNYALIIPLANGLSGCLVSGSGTPSLQGPVPYSSFQGQGLPTQLALTAPCQSPNSGNLYFLYFDGFNPSGGAGLMSVSQTAVVEAILLGSTNIPVTVLTSLGSLPLTCAFCVAEVNGQDAIYVAVLGWANQTTPQWSVEMIDTSGNMTTIISGQPGAPWGMCVVTVLG